jgi:hypothetical protein
MTTTTELPRQPGFVPLPEVCSGCGGTLAFEDEKVCVPGRETTTVGCEVSTFGASLRFDRVVGLDEPTRLFHPGCVPA